MKKSLIIIICLLIPVVNILSGQEKAFPADSNKVQRGQSQPENTPNSLNRIKEDRMAVLFFMRRLWDRGNTGNAPVGETFGQSETVDGEPTDFDDHVEVIADLTNNPQDRINAGERNVWIYYSFPTPAGSIKISVGILLRT